MLRSGSRATTTLVVALATAWLGSVATTRASDRGAAGAERAKVADYRRFELEIGSGVKRIHWGVRGDDAASSLSLFVFYGPSVKVWGLSPVDGFDADAAEFLRLPDEPALVDFGDVRGGPGEEVVLVTRRGVLADRHLELQAARSEGTGGVFGRDALASDPGGAFTPLDLRRGAITGRGGPIPLPVLPTAAPLLHDLDGDGNLEVVIPRLHRFEVYTPDSAGFVGTFHLEAKHRIELDPGGPEIIDPLELSVTVPGLDLRDINADGRVDIVAVHSGGRRFYLQGDKGFARTPSFTLDLERFRAANSRSEARSAPRRRPLDEIRGSDIRVHEVDIDRDGMMDYLIGTGRVLRVYFGSRDGIDFSRPHLARQLSGDVQGVSSFDVDRDGHLDLVAVKFDVPSIPRLLAAYFVPMSIEFEVLGYFNRGGRKLSHRPDRKETLTVEFPALRGIVENIGDFAARFLEARRARGRYTASDVDGDGRTDAVFVDDDDHLRVYVTAANDAPPATTFELGDVAFHPTKRRWELDSLIDFIGGEAYARMRERYSNRSATIEIPLGDGYAASHERLDVRDVTGDGRVDFVLESRGEGVGMTVLVGLDSGKNDHHEGHEGHEGRKN